MKRHLSERGPQTRRGFVLMLTLAMIVIAVTLTARTANRSITRTLESIDAESQLRDRWSRLSLQQAVLSRAEHIFTSSDADQPDTPPVLWHDAVITLAGTTYRLRLADENSKLNLNTIRRTHTDEAFQQLIGSALPRSLRTTPHNHASSKRLVTAPISLESWGQVFPSAPPSALFDATTKITLWGNGRLNIHRATDQSLRQLLEPLTSSTEVDAILRQRRESKSQSGQNLTTPSNNLPSGTAGDYLTLVSRCHSLWIMTTTEGATELHIQDRIATGARTITFRW